MGTTTNRMKGTAFAFIALAIAMLLFEFMEMPGNVPISGGESGLWIDVLPIMQDYLIYFIFVFITIILVVVAITSIFFDFRKRNHFLTLNFRRDGLATDFKEVEKTNNIKQNSLIIFCVLLFCFFLLLFIPNVLNMYQFAEDFKFKIPIQYYIVLTTTVGLYVFVKRVVDSPFGRVIAGIAQNEDRMEALGYNVFYYKIITVGISGALAAIAGSLYTSFKFAIDTPTTFGVLNTIDAMLFTIVGGLGTLLGPFLGTILVKFSEYRLKDLVEVFGLEGEWWLVILGVIFVFIVMFFPYGIVGSLQIRSNSIKTNLRKRFGIRDNDYWWISFILVFLAFILIVNLEAIVNWLIEFIQSVL
jgi:ABC-type branched-subunit amino acid transport system permease subunit